MIANRPALLDGGSAANFPVPSGDVAELTDIMPNEFDAFDPGRDGHVGNRVFVGYEFVIGEAAIEYTVKTLNFIEISGSTVRNKFRAFDQQGRIHTEVPSLAGHGPQS